MPARKRLLCIVTDDMDITRLLADAVDAWQIQSVSTLMDAERELRSHPYLVGLLMYNARFPRQSDLDGFLRRNHQVLWVGVFSAHDLERAYCRELLIEHLYDYHTAPVDPVRLAYTLGHAHGLATLRNQPAVTGNTYKGSTLIGNSEVVARLRAHIERIAQVTAPVLISGESGSGKELTAQAIHAHSKRSHGPFVPINCGAITPTLIHSELFGYERGAFTGANKSKVGLIEAAHGGTLFLDEIGDLPKDIQASILRFLQEKTICRLGSTREIKVDVRVIAASHVQLEEAVVCGAFREDLYYRLAVLPVTVPSLRERREDLVLLAQHFFHIHASERRPRLKGFSTRAIRAIQEHGWPGNVRELINRVRRALVMADGHLIMPEDLGLEQNGAILLPPALDEARMRTERTALSESLDRTGQNVSKAARHLGVSRTTMYRLLEKHGMRV